ncbi:hypothetical protein [Mesorhizobium loti]|uniref:hypothetical protein n=1 Tax=Rhizobium loti TaxID=381 RepID=UPI000479A077|nr:hypothetical protein [Mesorhizobium loti]
MGVCFENSEGLLDVPRLRDLWSRLRELPFAAPVRMRDLVSKVTRRASQGKSKLNVAYAIGLCCNRVVLRRLFLSIGRESGIALAVRSWGAAETRPVVANGLSFVIFVGVSISVRGGFELAAAFLHFVAKAIWLCVDL